MAENALNVKIGFLREVDCCIGVHLYLCNLGFGRLPFREHDEENKQPTEESIFLIKRIYICFP